nr:MAG TPA: hypothetical protein [Caudoviricetes sp.]
MRQVIPHQYPIIPVIVSICIPLFALPRRRSERIRLVSAGCIRMDFSFPGRFPEFLERRVKG